MAPSIPVNCARRDHASSRHDFGVYELTRVELLRDLYLWAYERSTREYLAIRQTLAEPNPLRLAYRAVIRRSVRDVVRRPEQDPIDAIRLAVEGWADTVAEADRKNLEALVVEELRRLHEGALARYGLRPVEYRSWRERQIGVERIREAGH